MSLEIRYYKLLAWGCLSSIRDFLGTGHNNFFSIVDASKIVSLEQIRIAYERALRLLLNSDRIKRPESAFLMLLSGEKQISRAQEEIGVSSSTKDFLAIFSDPSDIQRFEQLCPNELIRKNSMPVPERNLEKDSTVFTRMAKVELSI